MMKNKIEFDWEGAPGLKFLKIPVAGIAGLYHVNIELTPIEHEPEPPELKPCPFCGNEADADGCDYKYWVRCMHCDATTGTKTTMMQAASYWNRRAGTRPIYE